jgi:hypothetical protein
MTWMSFLDSLVRWLVVPPEVSSVVPPEVSSVVPPEVSSVVSSVVSSEATQETLR